MRRYKESEIKFACRSQKCNLTIKYVICPQKKYVSHDYTMTHSYAQAINRDRFRTSKQMNHMEKAHLPPTKSSEAGSEGTE